MYLAFLVVTSLGLATVVHELGHALMARFLGSPVHTVGLGIGPELFSVGTQVKWSLRLLPIGAFVEMKRTSGWRGFLISFGGPLLGILVGLPMTFLVPMTGGEPVFEYVASNGPLGSAGMRAGDRVIRFDHTEIQSDIDFYKALAFAAPGRGEHTIDISRAGKEVQLKTALPSKRSSWGIGPDAISTSPLPKSRSIVTVVLGTTHVESVASTIECMRRAKFSVPFEGVGWRGTSVLSDEDQIVCVGEVDVATPQMIGFEVLRASGSGEQHLQLGVVARDGSSRIVVVPVEVAATIESGSPSLNRQQKKRVLQYEPSLIVNTFANVGRRLSAAAMSESTSIGKLSEDIIGEVGRVAGVLPNVMWGLMWWTGVLSLLMSLTNLLPVPPLDGYRMISAMTPRMPWIRFVTPLLIIFTIAWFVFR